MLDDFDKCRFCRWYDNYEGCTDMCCCHDDRTDFKLDSERVIEKAKEMKISVTDVITLMNQVD